MTEFVTWDFDLRKWVRARIVIQDGKPCTEYIGEIENEEVVK